jgi:hypothetical protein
LSVVLRRRAIAPIGFWFAIWAGCSSDSGVPAWTGKAGHGGVTANGGTGGAAGTGGSAGGGGSGAGGASTTGGRGGAPDVPQAWTCNRSTYGDGRCDCGCGAPDVDCAQQDLAHCEVCNPAGGCNLAGCPGRIDPADVTRCLPPPAGWTCTPATYGDGHLCECGCGVRDIDCPNGDVASCNDCLAQGSCAHGLCPSSIAPGDNARCAVPARWTCTASTYGDGVCNCGCGAVDVDCPDAKASSCKVCDSSSCSPSGGCAVAPDDNAHCPAPPHAWRCSPRLYGDGIQCDCGCGAIDPDCASSSIDACDSCDDPGSCSALACPSFINATINAQCDMPPSPPGWLCGPGTYGDGLCDCGCGVPDVDCRTPDVTSCVRCLPCGPYGACSESSVIAGDPTQCAPPPGGWICSAAEYRDIDCDCGCGLPDPACQGIELVYVCGNYPAEGCSGGNMTHVNPFHNAVCITEIPSTWTCNRAYYDDGLCDCGCGAVDLDCPSNDAARCDLCNDSGSCSTGACPGTIAATDTAHCSN